MRLNFRHGWLLSVDKLLLALVVFVFIIPAFFMGCTKKEESPKKVEAQALAKTSVDDGKPFSFRGITMGVPLKAQFKDCKEKPATGACYKEGIKEDAYKNYRIEGLPKLEFETVDYVSLIEEKVELMLFEFNKEYASTNMMKLLKTEFGEPASFSSSMLVEKAGDIPYERFMATWNIKGCVLELSNVRKSITDSGMLLIKSEKFLKK